MSDPNYVRRAGGRPPKYPWDQWLDGVDKLLILRTSAAVKDAPPIYYYDPPKVVGEKPLRPAVIMQKQILNMARRREIMVSTEQRPDEAIGIRFTGSSRREVQPAKRGLTREETFDRMLNGDPHPVPVRTMPIGDFQDLVSDEAAARGKTAHFYDCDPLEDGTLVVGVQATSTGVTVRELGPDEPGPSVTDIVRDVVEPTEPLIRTFDRSEQ